MDLVTGGSGYFGFLLVNKLLQDGHQCRLFDLIETDDQLEDTDFHQGDIRDYQAILQACKGVEVVYHNVAQVPLAKDKKAFESVNILGTDNLLKACVEARVRKVVYTSSSAVFGIPQNNPVTEATTPHPGESYGKAKLAGEKLCHEYAQKGLDVSIIRPRTIMGHGRLGIFQILFEWIRQGYNIPVLNNGDNIYQFIHADDLAVACISAGEMQGSELYNIGTDRYGSMREVLENLTAYAATGSRVKIVPMTPAVLGMKITSVLRISPLGAYHSLMYGRSFYFDSSKAKNDLNWNPIYSNNEMFIESYDWYLNNRDDMSNSAHASHHRSGVKHGILSLVKFFL